MASDLQLLSTVETGALAAARLCNFGTGKAILLPAHTRWLDEVVAPLLRSLPDPWVDLMGYASHLGSHAFNKRLSLDRCEAVRHHIESYATKVSFPTELGRGDDYNTGTATDNSGLWRAVDISVFASKPAPVPRPVRKIEYVKFWIKAFIPRDVPGLTAQLLGGPDKGQTVLSYFGYFHTDQRDFSSLIGASSRIHLEFEVDLSAKAFRSGSTRTCVCGETKKYDGLITGRIEKRATATPKWAIDLRSSSPLIVAFSAAASNPCAFGSPDIDLKGTVSLNPTNGDLELDCLVDDFPYYEAYAATNSGAGFKIFNAPPLPGKTPGNLFGGPKRVIKAKLSDTNGDCDYDKQVILPGTVMPVS